VGLLVLLLGRLGGLALLALRLQLAGRLRPRRRALALRLSQRRAVTGVADQLGGLLAVLQPAGRLGRRQRVGVILLRQQVAGLLQEGFVGRLVARLQRLAPRRLGLVAGRPLRRHALRRVVAALALGGVALLALGVGLLLLGQLRRGPGLA